MSRQQLSEAKAELDAAWAEALKRADVALENVEEARSSSLDEDKASYLRITEEALFAHNRWTNAVLASVKAMDRHYEETALLPPADTD